MNDGQFLGARPFLWKLLVPVAISQKAMHLYSQEMYGKADQFLVDYFNNIVIDNKTDAEASIRDMVLLRAWCLYRLGKYADCTSWLKQSISMCYLDDHNAEAHLIQLWILCWQGLYHKVVDNANNYINENGNSLHQLLAEYLYLRGVGYHKLGNIESAVKDGESAVALFRILQLEKEIAEVSTYLGAIYMLQSNYTYALKWLSESHDINIKLGLSLKIATSHLNIGIAYYKMAKLSLAGKHIASALDINERQEHKASLCRCQIAMGNVSRLRCDCEDARKHLTAAYNLATSERLRREECLALEFLGDVFRDEGKPDEARRYYARGMAIAKEIAPEGDLVMELMRRDGECLGLLGDHAQAMSILAKARALSEKLGDRFEEGIILRCLAVSLASVGDWDNADRYMKKSISMLGEIDAKHELAISHLMGARILAAQADDRKRTWAAREVFGDAWHHALAAQHLFSELEIGYWVEESRKTINEIGKRKALCEGLQKAGTHKSVGGKGRVEIVAKSAAMHQVLQMSSAFAGYDESVLITGETGTGKELIARRLHELSHRRKKPLVAVNVAAIPRTMFEREFFGHHRGAFSGADRDSPGYVALAHGGTLFLDEIADLPLELQPKLLRLLQEGTYTSLGNPKEKQSNVRLIAATNQDLGKLVENGSFRQDLYYRIRVLEINIPPLRERKEDIIPLLEHFLQKVAGESSSVSQYFNAESIQALMRFPWQGNVREIAVAARRAHIGMATEGRVRFQLGMSPNTILVTGPENVVERSRAQSPADDLLRSRIIVALEESKGNKTEAARHLGVSRPTLYRWMKRLGV